jgi:hypothetical protein
MTTVSKLLTGAALTIALTCSGIGSAIAQTPGMEPDKDADPVVTTDATTDEAQAKPKPKKVELGVTGSFFTRYEYRRHYDDLGKAAGRFSEFDAFRYRARLGLKTSPIDIGDGQKVVLRFVPQASGVWADRGGTLSDSIMGVHEAVFRLKRNKMWLDVGRFEMIYGDHLVIGSVGWHETARSFDGARARFELGKKGAWVDGFVTQVAEGSLGVATTTLGAGDKMFLGAYAALGEYVGPKVALDLYGFAHLWPSTGNIDTAVEGTVGARFKRKMGKADVRAEAGVQLGKRNKAGTTVDTLAFQGEAELGFKVTPKLRLAAGGFFASGDDPTTADDEGWNQLYPTAHKFLGHMDLMGGRTNAMGAMVRARANASKQLNLGADVHYFLRPETAMGVDSYAGLEVNAWNLYKMGKGLGLRTAYHIFLPNETGPFGNDQVAHYIEIQFRYDLK